MNILKKEYFMDKIQLDILYFLVKKKILLYQKNFYILINLYIKIILKFQIL